MMCRRTDSFPSACAPRVPHRACPGQGHRTQSTLSAPKCTILLSGMALLNPTKPAEQKSKGNAPFIRFLVRASEIPTKSEGRDEDPRSTKPAAPYLGKLTGQRSANCVSCRHCSQQVVSRCSKRLFNSLEVASYKKTVP